MCKKTFSCTSHRKSTDVRASETERARKREREREREGESENESKSKSESESERERARAHERERARERHRERVRESEREREQERKSAREQEKDTHTHLLQWKCGVQETDRHRFLWFRKKKNYLEIHARTIRISHAHMSHKHCGIHQVTQCIYEYEYIYIISIYISYIYIHIYKNIYVCHLTYAIRTVTWVMSHTLKGMSHVTNVYEYV